LYGALVASRWNLKRFESKPWPAASTLLISIAAGLLMGYSSRLAFGCNVGAYLGGIASGSLHGWVWFAAAFAGSVIGIRFRNKLLKTSTDAAAKNVSANDLVLPARSRISTTAAIMLVLLLWIDNRNAEPINPFAAPWPTALGSGEAPSGAHCTDL
jgi:uncharacterized membrane protein YedE/YeeE